MTRSALGLLAVLCLAAARRPATAQESARAAAACDGRTVSAIALTPRAPSFARVPRRLRGLARAVGLYHTTTRPEVVGRFLLLAVGQPCTEPRRAESERILRLQPFIADATVRVVPDTAGGVRIEVETVDEIPTVLGMRLRDRRPAAVLIGNGNVGGRGVYLAAHAERGYAYRSGVGARLVAYQAFGRPYTLAAEVDRPPLGRTVTLALGHAFLTDLQRTAWHAGYSDLHGYASFVRPEGDRLSLAVDREMWDVGGVRRIGYGRRRAFGGVLVTHERVTPSDEAVVITDSGLVTDTGARVGGPVRTYDNARVNAVLGVRALSFTPARGFDALTAVQDVATGVQVGILAGRGVRRFGDDDLFLSADLYAGLGSAASFGALRIQWEGREDRATDRWDSIVGSGRVAWYFKPSATHVVIGSGEFSGGWRERIPFQLRLGDRHGGVRGYHGSRVAGAVRGVARIEDRWFAGSPTRHAALGVAAFVDAGRVWAGNAPFGVDSKVKVGVGVGLLAAVPPGSKRLWRLDLAFPASPDPRARLEIRLTKTETRGFWREPRDVARARAGAAPSTIFTWP